MRLSTVSLVTSLAGWASSLPQASSITSSNPSIQPADTRQARIWTSVAPATDAIPASEAAPSALSQQKPNPPAPVGSPAPPPPPVTSKPQTPQAVAPKTPAAGAAAAAPPPPPAAAQPGTAQASGPSFGPQDLQANNSTETPQIQIYGMSGFILYEWPEGTWLNHIAIRPNGQLVVTMYDRPEIHVFDPFTPGAAPLLAHRFTPNTRLQAITEYIPDHFAVLGTMYNGTSSSTMLWNLRLDSIGGPRLEWMAEVSDAENIVSLSNFNASTVLGANSNGAIHAINLNTGDNRQILTDPTMISGVSTVKYRAPYVYYVNTVQGSFARIPIDATILEPLAPAELIVDRATGIADVALAPFAEQEGYLVNYEQNTVLRVNAQAKVDKVMTGLKAPTAAQFGRTYQDQRTLYVVSGAPTGGKGKIVSINVGGETPARTS